MQGSPGGSGSASYGSTSGASLATQWPGNPRTTSANASRRGAGTWYITEVWNTTSVAPAGACAASAGRSSTRSPRTSSGGSAAATAAAARSRVAAVLVLRPDEGVEPGDVRGVGHVERVQVQAGPPHHLG